MTRTEVPDWVTLTADEEVVWLGHPSAKPLIDEAAVVVAAVVAGVALSVVLPPETRWAGALLAAVALALGAGLWLRHRSTTYVITTDEVYRKTGLLSRRVTNIRLDRVQNTAFTQTFVQRLVGYGDVHVDTAGGGGTELQFRDVPDPQRVNAVLTRRLDALDAEHLDARR